MTMTIERKREIASALRAHYRGNPRRWTKRKMAASRLGAHCDPCSDKASCWCLAGAGYAIGFCIDEVAVALGFCATFTDGTHYPLSNILFMFNDDPRRTFADIEARLASVAEGGRP